MELNDLRNSEMMAYLIDSLEAGKDIGHYGRLVKQVEQRGYSPPKRERVLEWMRKQQFPICPNADDPTGCNVYRELDSPQQIYERINAFYQAQPSAGT
jgi:hypothetical protein